jgi:uncharacterized RDD family membrane protein YckC
MHGKPASNQSLSTEHATPAPSSRAAKAAARVAMRFAQAPSYNEMLATEARAAVEAAEVAAVAAQEAHAKAQMVLAGIEAASNPEPESEPIVDPFWQPHIAEVVPIAPAARPAPVIAADSQSEPYAERFAIRWEPDLLLHEQSREGIRASVGPSLFETMTADWEETETEQAQPQEITVIEPAQPIFGNVIEFPRQIVATRKVRPRLAEGPLATPAAGAQLSIFEVDPGAISVEPEEESPRTTQQVADWSVPEWSTMRLAPEPQPEYELLEEPAPRPTPAPGIELAGLSRRVLAGVVDATLVAGAFVAAAALAANNATELPGLRAVEIGSVVALLVASAAYKLLFFTLARATPGMKYARLALCTFDGGVPTRAQRYARLAALLLSVLPVGLGFAWAIFDDEHMTWHDRISRTYLRVS